jgi:hypothetical protein
MTRAADSVGESVKTGLLDLRKRAVEAGKAGAEATAQAVEAAEEKFSERTGEVVKTSRRARKKLARKSAQTRKELARSSKAARKEALARVAEMRKPDRKAKKAAIQAAKAAGHSKRRGKKDFKGAKKDFKAALIEAKSTAKGKRKSRRWLWVLGLGAVAGGTALVLRSKQQPPVAPEPPRAAPSKPATAAPSPEAGKSEAAKTETKPAPSPKPAVQRNSQQTSSKSGVEKTN